MNSAANRSFFPAFKISKPNASDSSKKPAGFITEDRESAQLKRYFETLREAEKKQKKKGLKGKITLSSNLYDLYKAASPSQVYNVLKLAQGKVALMKSLGASDKEIAAAKGVLKKLSAKAEMKIVNLKKEQRLEELRQIETNAKHKEKVQSLTKELRQKRKARKSKERGDILAAAQEEYKKNNNPNSNQGITNDISETIPITDSSTPAVQLPAADTSVPANTEGQTIDISL